MSGDVWLIVAGFSFIITAVASDPWGRKPWCAALYLLGAALFIIGILA